MGITALFSSKTMTKITLVLWFNWVVITVGYYGISLGIGDMGPNVFINFFLVSLVEIPGDLFALLTIDRLGRRTLNVLCLFITGVGCLSAAYIEDGSAIKTILCLIGIKNCIDLEKY